MSNSARESIYEAIASIRLIDPHTHINPHAPASNTLADLLGYHYYTELAHSAGMPKEQIEEDGVLPRELVHRLVSNLSPIENTAQYRWLVEICRRFFGFEGDRLDLSNWEQVYDAAERQMQMADWPQTVLDQSNVEAVFLTNDFDDELSGFDTDTYIPCLRTDDLVFHLAKEQTRQRLEVCSGIELDGSLFSLRESLKQRFEHFVSQGARACAISLPPTFAPTTVSDGRAATALDEVLRKGSQADPSHQAALSRRVFWTLAELCDEFGLPFDLMIGVNRGVYEEGVFQGQDLYDSRVSLIQYRELFNAFPAVKFPVSVLASVTNQELVSYAWIFPNVLTNGHWWYSNTPSFIARDAAARLEAVPQTKQIAYYSDAYKLEFVWPKFDMYRRILAGILADHFVDGCGWSEERAVELGRQVLRDNVDEVFPRRELPSADSAAVLEDTWAEDGPQIVTTDADSEESAPAWIDPAVAGSSAALAAGAIGMVEVGDADGIESNEAAGGVAPSSEPEQSDSFDDDESFSTVIMPVSATEDDESSATEFGIAELSEEESSEQPADNAVESSLDEEAFPTVVEDSPSTAETVRMDEVDGEPSDADSELTDMPTVLELEDTVRMEDTESEELGIGSEPTPDNLQDTAIPMEPPVEPAVELDPLPSDDEIQAVDVGDVELRSFDLGDSMPNAETIEAEAESEPIDVGDLLGDAGETSGIESPDIRLLRGEDSFQPDEDSLQLQPDPATGELTFPVAGSEEDGGNGLADTVDEAEMRLEPTDEGDVRFDPHDDANVLAETDDDIAETLEDWITGDAFDDEATDQPGAASEGVTGLSDDPLGLEDTIEIEENGDGDKLDEPQQPHDPNH